MNREQQEVTPELLETLHLRYPLFGAIVIGSDSFTSVHYDQQGNELLVTVQAGKEITYREKRR